MLHIRSVPLTIERSIPSIQDILFFIFTAPFVWCDFSISHRKQLVQCEKSITDYRKMLYMLLKCKSHLIPLRTAVLGIGYTFTDKSETAVKWDKLLLAGENYTPTLLLFCIFDNTFHKP